VICEIVEKGKIRSSLKKLIQPVRSTSTTSRRLRLPAMALGAMSVLLTKSTNQT
jgi:hypothetical protein